MSSQSVGVVRPQVTAVWNRRNQKVSFFDIGSEEVRAWKIGSCTVRALLLKHAFGIPTEALIMDHCAPHTHKSLTTEILINFPPE